MAEILREQMRIRKRFDIPAYLIAVLAGLFVGAIISVGYSILQNDWVDTAIHPVISVFIVPLVALPYAWLLYFPGAWIAFSIVRRFQFVRKTTFAAIGAAVAFSTLVLTLTAIILFDGDEIQVSDYNNNLFGFRSVLSLVSGGVSGLAYQYFSAKFQAGSIQKLKNNKYDISSQPNGNTP